MAIQFIANVGDEREQRVGRNRVKNIADLVVGDGDPNSTLHKNRCPAI